MDTQRKCCPMQFIYHFFLWDQGKKWEAKIVKILISIFTVIVKHYNIILKQKLVSVFLKKFKDNCSFYFIFLKIRENSWIFKISIAEIKKRHIKIKFTK